MNDRIGRAAHRHVDLDGVVEGAPAQDFVGCEIVPHHVDNAPPGRAAHARMIGIDRRQ
jgi:hypothetical protein